MDVRIFLKMLPVSYVKISGLDDVQNQFFNSNNFNSGDLSKSTDTQPLNTV